MPPPQVKRPPAERITAFTTFVQSAFEEPTAPCLQILAGSRRTGSIAANTAIPFAIFWEFLFRAEKYFPTDDSGDGFDNIGDVLTVSPVLMERYLGAAERIASWALSTEIPAKPIESLYHFRDRRSGASIAARLKPNIALISPATTRFASVCRASAPRPHPRSNSAFGWTASSSNPRPSRPSRPDWCTSDPYSEEEMRLYLPEGDHVFRAGFIDDEFVKTFGQRRLQPQG